MILDDGDDYIIHETFYENRLINEFSRTSLTSTTEMFFTFAIFVVGVTELFFYGEKVCGFCLLTVSFMFLCLSLEFYYGYQYNCTALLFCHTGSAGIFAALLFILTMVAILTTNPFLVTVIWFRTTTVCLVATSVISIILLVSFAASSYNRAKEIWAMETARTEHLKQLLETAIDVARMGNVARERAARKDGRIVTH